MHTYSLAYFSFYSFIVVVSCSSVCYTDVEINYEHPIVPEESQYKIIEETLLCSNTLNQKSSEEPTTCPIGTLTVDVSPVPMIPVRSNVLPHVNMNISVMPHVHVDSMFVRMECLQASDHDDVYCHEPQSLVRDANNNTIFPCRGLELQGSKPMIPFRFAYNCFRMFGFSQYRVNVTVFPQNCRTSQIVTIPSIGELFPEIMHIFNGTTVDRTSARWSPLLAIDMDESNGVWIRFSPPIEYPWREMKLAVAEKLQERSLKIIEEFTVSSPSTGVKWSDAPSGEYSVFAYVPRHDCSLICDSLHPHCKICTHTPLNFTLTEHKASIAWKAVRTVRDAGIYLMLIWLLFIILFALAGFSIVNYLKRRSLRNPKDLELTERPSVLLVFADDCQEHMDVVIELANSIERLANARVLVDQNELVKTGVQPSRWLVDSLTNCDFVLVVVSPTCPLLLEGYSLVNRRPFPDLFNTAVNMIISEVSTKHTKDRFGVVRLPYSPTTPPQLGVLGLKTFEVPCHLALLTAFLHRVPLDTTISHDFEEKEKDGMKRIIDPMIAMIGLNEEWMKDRVKPKTDSTIVDIDMDYLAISSDPSVPIENVSHEERVKQSEEYGLVPPDEEHEQETTDSSFALLPPDSTDSETD